MITEPITEETLKAWKWEDAGMDLSVISDSLHKFNNYINDKRHYENLPALRRVFSREPDVPIDFPDGKNPSENIQTCRGSYIKHVLSSVTSTIVQETRTGTVKGGIGVFFDKESQLPVFSVGVYDGSTLYKEVWALRADGEFIQRPIPYPESEIGVQERLVVKDAPELERLYDDFDEIRMKAQYLISEGRNHTLVDDFNNRKIGEIQARKAKEDDLVETVSEEIYLNAKTDIHQLTIKFKDVDHFNEYISQNIAFDLLRKDVPENLVEKVVDKSGYGELASMVKEYYSSMKDCEGRHADSPYEAEKANIARRARDARNQEALHNTVLNIREHFNDIRSNIEESALYKTLEEERSRDMTLGQYRLMEGVRKSLCGGSAGDDDTAVLKDYATYITLLDSAVEAGASIGMTRGLDIVKEFPELNVNGKYFVKGFNCDLNKYASTKLEECYERRIVQALGTNSCYPLKGSRVELKDGTTMDVVGISIDNFGDIRARGLTKNDEGGYGENLRIAELPLEGLRNLTEHPMFINIENRHYPLPTEKSIVLSEKPEEKTHTEKESAKVEKETGKKVQASVEQQVKTGRHR